MPDQNEDQGAAPENNGNGNNQNQNNNGGGFWSFANKAMDKIPEGPILGHVIPGWMAAHKVATGLIIAAVAIPTTAVLAGALHAWWNSSYTDDYKALLDGIAKESAITCSLDDADRKLSTYKKIQSDVKDAGDASVFGIVVAPLGWIPYVGGIVPDFEWMPNKKIYDALYTAEQNNIRFYRADGGFEKGLQTVIFNDGANPPIMVYSTLEDGQLLEMMNTVRTNGGVKEGALVMSWNDAAEKFEVEQVALGATEVSVIDGLDSAPIPVNSCLVDNTFTTRAIEGAKGWVPTFGFGGDDDEGETVEDAEIIEQDEIDAEIAEEPVTEDADTEVIETIETVEPEAEEDGGWFKMPKISLPWGGDDEGETTEEPEATEVIEEDHSSIQPVRALNFG